MCAGNNLRVMTDVLRGSDAATLNMVNDYLFGMVWYYSRGSKWQQQETMGQSMKIMTLLAMMFWLVAIFRQGNGK